MPEEKHDAEGAARMETYLESIGMPRSGTGEGARSFLGGDVGMLHAQVVAMKLRALAAHYAIWHAMNGRPGDAIRALQDDGAIHQAVHAIIAVETESVSVPEEWRAHLKRQDRRIDALEAQVREQTEEADRWRRGSSAGR